MLNSPGVLSEGEAAQFSPTIRNIFVDDPNGLNIELFESTQIGVEKLANAANLFNASDGDRVALQFAHHGHILARARHNLVLIGDLVDLSVLGNQYRR